MECNNLCHRVSVCEYCKKHYNVSDVFYKAKRQITNGYVVGYLVRNKNEEIQGILNKDSHFYELAFIDETTIEIFEGGTND